MKRLARVYCRVLFLAAVLIAVGAEAAGPAKRKINVLGRKSSVVSTKEATLADIARIDSKLVRDDDAVIALSNIVVAKSPTPGESITLSASQVLERMREEGVQIEEIGYAFPRVMTIERASRPISLLEVETLIRETLPTDGDSELLEVRYDETVRVAPGGLTMSAEILPSNRPGTYLAKILAEVEGAPAVRFNVALTMKEWVEVPVAKRPLARGAIISSSDIVMARAELSELPVDAARETEQIVGQETKQPIGYGEVFRKNKIAIPPMVERGARVTLMYRTATLEATASGVTLEEGIEGQQIRVRNDSSKKTVVGEVVSPGLIKVSR